MRSKIEAVLPKLLLVTTMLSLTCIISDKGEVQVYRIRATDKNRKQTMKMSFKIFFGLVRYSAYLIEILVQSIKKVLVVVAICLLYLA